MKARLTGFYTTIQDANEISFFFADGIGGDNANFVQEILQGINKKHLGAELGIEAQVTSTIKLKGAASVGQYTYDNNPNLYLTTTPDPSAPVEVGQNGVKDFGEANLKDYKIAEIIWLSKGANSRDLDEWAITLNKIVPDFKG